MSTRFSGFPPEALEFFRELRSNNNRDWFQPRKSLYEERVKRPMEELIGALNRALADFAPEFATDPGKAVFRIYRDTRFSPDKTPYKDHIAASFRRRGAGPHGGGGFYISLSDKEAAIGGGVYDPPPEMLLELRQHVAARHEELRKILLAAPVRKLFGEMRGEKLIRVPKGFPADHPAADLLRFKNYILYATLPPEVAITPEFHREIVKRFRATIPFLQFLAAAKAKSRKG